MRRDIVLAGLVVFSLSLGACRRKQVPVAAVPMTPSTAPATGIATGVDRSQFLRDSIERARADSLARLASSGDAANLRTALEAAVRRASGESIAIPVNRALGIGAAR